MNSVLGLTEEQLRRDRTSIKWAIYPPSVLPVWVAEMDAAPCPAVVEAVHAAMSRGDTGYTGPGHYANAYARFAADRWGLQVEPTWLETAPDVMIGVRDLIEVCTDPGGAVVISPPVYNAFYGFITGYGRRVVEAPMSAEGRLDPDALEAAFGSATAGGARAVYLLSNPHNPLGTVHTAEELTALAGLADQHGVQVIADEIHAPLIYSGSTFVPYLSLPAAQRGITVFSASKAFNVAGLKCALTIPGAAARDTMALVPEVSRHGASHVASIAHTAALDNGRDWLDQLVSELDNNRILLRDRLIRDAPAVGYHVPDSTYLAWLDFRNTGLGADPAEELRVDGDVALSRGLDYGPEGAGFARLNFATSPEVLNAALDRVVDVLRRATD